MTTFTVTTTWGSKHWDVYGRRCVESILEHWPLEVKKIFYPDDVSQSVADVNTEYYCLAETQPQLQKFIDRNKNALVMAIASHVTLQNAKNFLINKMSEIQSVGHFLRTSTGYRVTSPEGYVAVDKVAGAVKLVDRLEFSRANFTMPKGWS